jgi:hypothetical protein
LLSGLQSHGIRQLLVYCLGKREGDWPAITRGSYRLIAFRLMKFCKTSSAAAVAPSADGGELTFVPTTASSKRRDKARCDGPTKLELVAQSSADDVDFDVIPIESGGNPGKFPVLSFAMTDVDELR